ncbi:hypothetical protein HY772_04430 [Candidatus Woesearchaeota archaeon]|nr:hypothetical protein [Candidatus Woesearchaeota archaeon]
MNEDSKEECPGAVDDSQLPTADDVSNGENRGETAHNVAQRQSDELTSLQLMSLRLEVSALRKVQCRSRRNTLLLVNATALACAVGGVASIYPVVESNRSAMRREMHQNLEPLVKAKEVSPEQVNMIIRDTRVGYFQSLSTAKIHDAVVRSKAEADAYVETNRQFREYTTQLLLDVTPDAFDRSHVNALNKYLELRLFMSRAGIEDKTDIAKLGLSTVEAINKAYRNLTGSIAYYVQRNPQAFQSIGGSRLEAIARDTAKQLGIKEVNCSGADCELVIKKYIAEYAKPRTTPQVDVTKDPAYTSLLQRLQAAEAKVAGCEAKKKKSAQCEKSTRCILRKR